MLLYYIVKSQLTIVNEKKIKKEIDSLVYSVVGKTDKHKKWGFKTQCMGDFKTFWDWTILN